MGRQSEFEAIGTQWHIDVYDEINAFRFESLMDAVRERIEFFDKTYSRFRADSLISIMAHSAGSFLLPDDATPMIEVYRKLYDLTSGAVTPLIGQALSDAGYDAVYSLISKPMTSPKPWDEIMTFKDSTLELREPALLDFGAAGKGHLIDIVAVMLRAEGIESFCVEAGGDMCHQDFAEKSLRVGLENPVDTSQVIGIASIANKSICGSAGNKRAWEKFHHILDPRTLTSPKHILAVWVVADTTLIADGLTTALMFVAPDVLQNEFDFEYAILHHDFSITASAGFPGEFFS